VGKRNYGPAKEAVHGLLKQELSNQILQYVRSVLLDREHPEWNEAAAISGRGQLPSGANDFGLINESAPELTSPDAKDFKDAVKQLHSVLCVGM